MASEEHELGVHALAVPLRNMQGQTVAALNVVAAPQRLEMRAMQRDLLPLLLEAAAGTAILCCSLLCASRIN